MTLDETRKLLRYIAAIDGRRITRDTETAWHHLFARHEFQPVFDATQTAIRNASGRYLEASMIFDVLRGQPAPHRPTRHCTHGQPLGRYCHDCTHNGDCYACKPATDKALMAAVINNPPATAHGITTTCPCNLCGGTP